MTPIQIHAVDKVEILTLQDNYIDMTAMDNNAVVTRALPIKNGQIKTSIVAEHGYSAIVYLTSGNKTKGLLFDFGFSKDGAAHNASTLAIEMKNIEAAVLSHGHSDHTGGLETLSAMIGAKNIPLFVHPGVFKNPRYMKFSEQLKLYFPEFTRDQVFNAGMKIIETKNPILFMDNDCLFLGEIPKKNDFEKGIPIAFYNEDGVEKWDAIEDDTSIVMNLKGKGLIILSGCAHAGIINTVAYAKALTGADKVHAVMGGFHLSGPLFEPIIHRTAEELKKLSPRYIIPCHCSGRKAIMHMEKEMPDQFILNMAGTKLTFES